MLRVLSLRVSADANTILPEREPYSFLYGNRCPVDPRVSISYKKEVAEDDVLG